MEMVQYANAVGVKYAQTLRETNALSVNAHPPVHKKAVKRGTS